PLARLGGDRLRLPTRPTRQMRDRRGRDQQAEFGIGFLSLDLLHGLDQSRAVGGLVGDDQVPRHRFPSWVRAYARGVIPVGIRTGSAGSSSVEAIPDR